MYTPGHVLSRVWRWPSGLVLEVLLHFSGSFTPRTDASRRPEAFLFSDICWLFLHLTFEWLLFQA